MRKGVRRGLPWHGQNGPEARTARGSAENKKANREGLAVLDGGQGRSRTADTGIFSPLLYQLSYLAVGRKGILDVRGRGGVKPTVMDGCGFRAVPVGGESGAGAGLRQVATVHSPGRIGAAGWVICRSPA